MHSKPTVISFRNNIENTEIIEKEFEDWPVEMIHCESFRELSKIIEKEPILIIAAQSLIRKYGSIEEFLLMVETMVRFGGQKKVPSIGIGFDKNITQEEIRNAQKNSLSLFPSAIHFGSNEALGAIEKFLITGRSWPKHLIDSLSVLKEQPKFKGVYLTNRQQQVYDLIARRGLTNKQIAQVLKISESTVKIHVSAVMKALCVRNRTQIALTK